MAVVILTELRRPQRASIAVTGHVLHYNNWMISLIRHIGTEDAAGKDLVSHVGKCSTLLSYQIAHHEQHTTDRRTIRERVHMPRDRQTEAMQPGTVYLAPPALHLIVGRDWRLALTDGYRIRHVLSSANPLFASAAEAFGARVIAVVLTGSDRDATDGVQAVKVQGGIVIAQDRATSEWFAMPRLAIETGCVDRILPLGEIAPALVRLVTATTDAGGGSRPVPADTR